MKLNLGCGIHLMDGWMNVDMMQPVVKEGQQFHLMNLDTDQMPEAWHGKAEFIFMSHILEHLKNPLFVMEELWKIAAPNCELQIKVPYGSSDNAWEDPTHVRPYFIGSFLYFSQLYYGRADYGYRGDWNIDTIHLDVFEDRCINKEGQAVLDEVKMKRNMVKEMIVTMQPVKPIRKFEGYNNTQYKISLGFVKE